jgi:hypothetical protein
MMKVRGFQATQEFVVETVHLNFFIMNNCFVVVFCHTDDSFLPNCNIDLVCVLAASCPAIDPPRGGGTQNCSFPALDFDACAGYCPVTTGRFVDDTPDYYTCDPSGTWVTLQDDEGLYPTCGRKCWIRDSLG